MAKPPSARESFLDELTDRLHTLLVLTLVVGLGVLVQAHDLIAQRLR
jgi:hypothetical protein